jgi:hypothetical protein
MWILLKGGGRIFWSILVFGFGGELFRRASAGSLGSGSRLFGFLGLGAVFLRRSLIFIG